MDHIEQVAAAFTADVVAYAKSHPRYAEMVQALAEKAIRALADEAGIAL